PNRIRIAQEEIFGPVVSVIPFADEDEAIRIANDSTYGLGGMVLTRDTARAIALAKRIRTGVVWINNGINFLDAPFGGFKESGIGREGGRFGMEEYTEMQQIVWKACRRERAGERRGEAAGVRAEGRRRHGRGDGRRAGRDRRQARSLQGDGRRRPAHLVRAREAHR